MADSVTVAYREWAQVTVAARLELVANAVRALADNLRGRNVDPAALYSVELAVTEAVTNAVTHGSASADRPEIRLDWSWQGEWLDVLVSGPGSFEPPPDWNRLPVDELQESGRGGFLMSELMDEVRHQNARGTHTLHLRKRLGAAGMAGAPPEDLEATLAAMTEDLSASYEVLSTLFRLAQALATAEDLRGFAAQALQLRSVVGADAMQVRLRDENGGLVSLAVAGDLRSPERITVESNAVEAEAFRTQAERTVELRHRLAPDDPLYSEHGCAFISPLDFQGRPWGVSVLLRDRDAPFFTAGQLSLARTVTEFLGIACANAELQQQRQAQLQARRELEIAAQIQASLLPTQFPERADWALHGCCVNAQEVGGDFFDVIEVREGVLVVIADVMGKGVPAALLALVLRTAVRAHAHLAATPGTLLTAVNTQLAADLEQLGIFITAQMVFLAAGAARVNYASAGHCPLVRLGSGGGAPLPGVEGGTPLGVVRGEQFQEHALPLRRGERLLLLTDGLIETADPQGRLLGLDGLIHLADGVAGESAGEACRLLLRRVHEFGAGRAATDDRTIVIIDALS